MHSEDRNRVLVVWTTVGLLSLLIVSVFWGCGRTPPTPVPAPRAVVTREPDLKTQLAFVSAGWNDRLAKFSSLVVPEHVNEDWNNVIVASREIQEKVQAMIGLIEKLKAQVDALGEVDAKMTDRLDAMIAEFERLEEEAETEVEGLLEYREAARREVKSWRKGAEIVKAFKSHYGGTLDHYESQVAMMDKLQPRLQRMMTGAKLYEEIGEFGKTVEESPISDFADELNKVLDLFDTLARFTEKAIGEAADPAAIPVVAAVINADPEIFVASLEVAR